MLLAYALALLTASVVALTVTPALALALFSRPPRERREGRLVRSLQPTYHQGLLRVLRHPRPVFAAAVFLAVVGLAGLPLLDQALLPTFRERDLLIDVAAAPGTSRPEMTRITAAVARELRTIGGVRSVGAHVGRAIMSDAVVGIDAGQLWVSLAPAADYDATMAAVEEVIAGYPGLRLELDTYLNRTADEVTTVGADEIAVSVFGPDAGVLREEAEKVRATVSDVAGVADTRLELPVEEAVIDVEVDLTAAQRHGVKPGDVRRAAATLLSGIEVGNLFEDQKVFEVVVWGVPELRENLTTVRNLLIDTPDGGQIRLSDVADVRVSATPQSISRENISRYLDVVATVEGRDMAAVRRDIQQRLAGLDFPVEYHPDTRTLHDEQQAAVQRLLGVAAAAAIGIFLLLQAAFRSWRVATLAFVALPVALVGGVIAAFLGGGVLSLGSLFGFLTVLAIAARGEVGLIRLYQRMEEAGVPIGAALVLHGARDRLGTTVMTALGTAAMFVPFLVIGDRPGLEGLRPTAIVVLGGLVTTLLLHLFLLPVSYLRLRAGRQPVEVDQSIPIAAGPQVAGAM
jgi:Cu/Ag efflux pump CusA